MSSESPIPDYLAKLNAHERDPFIEFDPVPHLYTVRGEGGYTSVTTFVHSHFEHFDPVSQAEKIVRGRNMSNPNYKYYGMTAEQIVDMWKKSGEEASSAGTKMHYDIECYWNGWNVENASIEYEYFRNFVADFQAKNPGTKAYRTEWMVYYEELKLSGSIDMVFENPDGTLRIYDWKRCKQIENEAFGGKCANTECIRHLPDAKFWHYSLQLNTYKTILEEKYGKKITELCLVCLHPENAYKKYDLIPVPFLEKEMRDLFEYRRNQVNMQKEGEKGGEVSH
jgi:ATP-dependent exoDNAse (exonuclease V) beta subunit